MKIRSDFVTNSSSSSYVIAYKTLPEIDNETLAKYPFLKGYSEMVEKVLFTGGDNDTSAGEKISSIKEYDEYFIDNYGWSKARTIESILKDDEYLNERYKKSRSYLNQGYNILLKDVDYNDSYCSNIIRELANDNDSFIILEDE